jgi:GR25 family glycosyltransferase involved in LPS biosynthesis
MNDFFDRIFVINLERRLDRLENILTNLSKINVSDYEVIKAVDGLIIDQPGWEGLRQTYINIFKIVQEKKYNNFLIIEDDCDFEDGFSSQVLKFLNTIPNDYDIIYFGGNHFSKPECEIKIVNENVIKVSNTVTTHCIGFSVKNFDLIFNSIVNEKNHVDLIFAKLQNELSVYSSIKNLTRQIPSYSDIERRFVNYDHVLKYNFS